MKNVVKKILAGLLAFVMVASITACKGSNSSSSSATTQKPISISFVWWGDTVRAAKYNALCDAFTLANPGITVVRSTLSWTDYWPKLATQVAGGNAPDVMGMHPQYAADYASRGVLLDLAPFFKDGTIDNSQISDSVYNGGKIGNLMCMLSAGVVFSNFIANNDILKKYNITTVPDPKGKWTWDQFATTAKKFTDGVKAAGVKNLYFTSDSSAAFQTFRYQCVENGHDLYTTSGDIAFTQAEVQQWFQYWKDLRDYGCTPDGAASTVNASAAIQQNMFTLGKLAVYGVPANQMTQYQAAMGTQDLELVQNPTGNDGKPGFYIEGSTQSIYAKIDKDHQIAAAKFLNFFCNDQTALGIFKMEQGVPPNTKLAKAILPLLNPVEVKEINFVNDLMPIAVAPVYPPAGATNIDTAFQDAGHTVWFNTVAPAAAAATFFTNAKNLLAQNKAQTSK